MTPFNAKIELLPTKGGEKLKLVVKKKSQHIEKKSERNVTTEISLTVIKSTKASERNFYLSVDTLVKIILAVLMYYF